MSPKSRRAALRAFAAAAAISATAHFTARAAAQATPAREIEARVVAVDIPGASAIAPVGSFLTGSACGSPIPTNFPGYIQSGAVLDPNRLLVASSSNFGAPIASRSDQAGALLSITLNPLVFKVVGRWTPRAD